MSEPYLGTSPFEMSVVDSAVVPPAAVLFDMDGTLIDSEKLWTISIAEYARHRGGELSSAIRHAMVGSNMRGTMRMLLDDLGIPADAEEIREAAEWVERRTADLFRQGVPWRAGAQEALRAIRSAGTPTALVTSTIRSLTEIALDTLGRDAFDVTVCGDEVDGRNKPDPEPYLRACRMLGVEPADCVAIEDSPAGMSSAVTSGCFVIGIPCEVPLEQGQRRVLWNSLEDLDMTKLGAFLP
jgi:HAD superfamily hydrolase (TIGR01509 family)